MIMMASIRVVLSIMEHEANQTISITSSVIL